MDHDLDQINAVPLVDVMLVLLAIVLTTATFISTGQIPVDLAEAKNAGAPRSALMITITADGELYFNQAPLTVDALGRVLSPYPKDSDFVIRADRTIDLDRFITVVDSVKALGFDRVGLQVKR